MAGDKGSGRNPLRGATSVSVQKTAAAPAASSSSAGGSSSKDSSSSPVFGLYLGSTNMCVAMATGKSDDVTTRLQVLANANGERVTPAVIRYMDGEKVVGTAALQSYHRHSHFTIRHALSYISSEDRRQMAATDGLYDEQRGGFVVGVRAGGGVGGGQFHSVQQVVTDLLRHLHEVAMRQMSLSDKVSTLLPAVLVVPCHWHVDQLQLLHSAAAAAGFRLLDHLSWPLAAVLAHGLNESGSEEEQGVPPSARSALVCVLRVGGLWAEAACVRLCAGGLMQLASPITSSVSTSADTAETVTTSTDGTTTNTNTCDATNTATAASATTASSSPLSPPASSSPPASRQLRVPGAGQLLTSLLADHVRDRLGARLSSSERCGQRVLQAAEFAKQQLSRMVTVHCVCECCGSDGASDLSVSVARGRWEMLAAAPVARWCDLAREAVEATRQQLEDGSVEPLLHMVVCGGSAQLPLLLQQLVATTTPALDPLAGLVGSGSEWRSDETLALGAARHCLLLSALNDTGTAAAAAAVEPRCRQMALVSRAVCIRVSHRCIDQHQQQNHQPQEQQQQQEGELGEEEETDWQTIIAQGTPLPAAACWTVPHPRHRHPSSSSSLSPPAPAAAANGTAAAADDDGDDAEPVEVLVGLRQVEPENGAAPEGGGGQRVQCVCRVRLSLAEGGRAAVAVLLQPGVGLTVKAAISSVHSASSPSSGKSHSQHVLTVPSVA